MALESIKLSVYTSIIWKPKEMRFIPNPIVGILLWKLKNNSPSF